MTFPSELDQSKAGVAKAMFSAQVDGRLDEMFAYIHPDIRCMPVTRPGRTLYVGHEETMQLIIDVRSSLGEHRIDWQEFSELDDGRLVCIGQPVMIREDGEVFLPFFECFLTFRDGLVIQLESRPRADS
jgi:ketosteroid isomerase-like protein